MSRYIVIAAIAILLEPLCGSATAREVGTGEPPTCVKTVSADSRKTGGHPAKSIRPAKRSKVAPAECANAQAAGKPLVLVSFIDARGGLALERGRLERAALQLGERTRRSAAESTNLCVAHTALRQFEEARRACDGAVDRAVADRARPSNRMGRHRLNAEQAVAVAYSNRAVMHWLLRDGVAAHQDLARASILRPASSYVTQNSEVTGRAPSLAQVLDSRRRIG